MHGRAGILLILLTLLATSASAEDYWVTSDRLESHTCPSITCGVAGALLLREKATVLEVRNGWGRITKYYYASCQDGISQYVKSGRKDCGKDNGIVDGQFAEWVTMKPLSKQRPANPAAGAIGDAALVAKSDDYLLHKDTFIKAAKSLIANSTCTEADFKEGIGWMKTIYRDRPVYFVYCGEWKISNKVYLDVSNGKTFK